VPKNQWRFDSGFWTTDYTATVQINATCPGGSCVQTVSLSSVTVPVIPTPAGINLCESTGNVLGGDLTVNPTGKAWLLFDEVVDPLWQIPPWITDWKFSTADASSGVTCIEVYLNQSAFYIARVNPQLSYPASDYTHITFKVKAMIGRGAVNVGMGAGNSTGQLDGRYFGGLINSPEYKTGAQVDEFSWHTITIPLSDLGLGNTGILQNELWFFYFWPGNWDYVPTNIYMDEISLVNYATSYNPQNLPTSNINSGYVYNPSSSGAGVGGTPSDASTGSVGNPYAWAGPVTAVLVLIIVGLIAAIIYIKFVGSRETV